jgi:hypothetical protein
MPLPFMNISAPDRPWTNARELRGALAVAKERAKGCEYGSFVGLCEAWVPQEWERIAVEEGFKLALNMTGMAATELLPTRRAPADLEFRRATDETTARDIAMVNGHAYQMPLDLFECICNRHLWREDTFGYVGYIEERAVTAASVFPVAGTMYVAFVATRPGGRLALLDRA